MIWVLASCKKKTTINVSLFNPALGQFVPGATIALVERADKMGGVECREIATAVTDAEGRALFDGAKLRSEQKYQYFCAVTESWGIKQGYPCSGFSADFLSKGKNQDWLMSDEEYGFLTYQFINLLSPSQPGDSMYVKIFFHSYINLKTGTSRGGAYVLQAFPSHGDKQYPYPSIFEAGIERTIGGRYTAEIKKIKMGVVTNTKQDFVLLPNQTFKLRLEW